MRLLVVSDVSPSVVRGGGERVLWEQTSRLVKGGHRVRILSRSPAEGTAGTAEQHAVKIQHFPVDRRSPLRFALSSILQARSTTARALAEEDADVLHLHQPLSGYGVLRSPAGRTIPNLYTFHSSAPLEYRSRRGMTGFHRSGWAGSLNTIVLRLLEGMCLRRATLIHVLSDFSATQLQKLYRIPSERIVKIPGGVDTERFQPAEDRDAVRKSLGLPTGMPLLFTLRNLEARMGLDILIRAMAILRERSPDVLLLIGGTGSLRENLESLTTSLDLRDHVRFLGFVPEAELPHYYQAADAFVLPTRELEGFGLVTVEALACGTPVLGTAVGATPEILRPLDASLIIRGTPPEGLAEDLWQFLQAGTKDPAAALDLRQACRRHVEKHYSWEQSVTDLETVLRGLTARDTTSRGGISTHETAGLRY